jgi:hypothetical protein
MSDTQSSSTVPPRVPVRGLDATANLARFASQLYAKGYRFVARYIFSRSAFKTLLTRDEACAISAAGLDIVTVYENGSPTSDEYFTGARGETDSSIAVERATAAGQPGGPIYLAIDYDPANPAIADEYFQSARAVCAALGGGFHPAVYASGAVCRHLKEAGLVSRTWLSQSRGFAGYEDWLPHADIVQGPEVKELGLDVDLDTAYGNGGGWRIAP